MIQKLARKQPEGLPCAAMEKGFGKKGEFS